MITLLDLQHFKCFELLHLPLAPLTLLSGTNASGKSSILQSLVLLHQTIKEHEWSRRLMLNGNSIRLGNVSDVIDQVNGRNQFGIGLQDGNNHYFWYFKGDRAEMSLSVDIVTVNGKKMSQHEMLRFLLPYKPGADSPKLAYQLRDLTYITAERFGPREIYTLEDRQTASIVGPTGGNAVSVLHWKRDEKIIDTLVLPQVPNTCLRQVEERMRLFFPGCSLLVQQVPQANAVTLGLRTLTDMKFHRPIHEGFGLTQILPIVVAVLTASKGNILLIENPEVHLHPAGQALMGQFLAEAAMSGVQVILETHSDHVLNGIRRSVKSKCLEPEQVALHFFKQRSPEMAQVISPFVDENGNIDVWPEGFFDQFDQDMDYFAGWGN